MKHLRTIYHICAFAVLSLLLAPANVVSIAMYLMFGIAIFGLTNLKIFRIKTNVWIHKNQIPIELLLTTLCAHRFYLRWLPSSQVSLVAKMLHMSQELFLAIVAVGLGVFAIGAVDYILNACITNVKKIEKVAVSWKHGCHYCAIIFTIAFQYISIQYSSIGTVVIGERQGLVAILANVIILFAINAILLLILQRWTIVLYITSALLAIWSIANYYVILFHGGPLYISELMNTKTAFAVAGTYTYELAFPVVFAVLIFLVQIYCVNKYVLSNNDYVFLKRMLVRVCVVILSGFLSVVFCNLTLRDKEPWTGWNTNIPMYGFMVCAMEDLKGTAQPILEPEGYDVAKLPKVSEGNITNVSREYPDIILILNETFCDPAYYTSITADVDYMTDFYSVPNAKYGYAITPNAGGGTNNSEFELLFSKSMHLLSSAAPFMYLNHELEERSVVQYVERLGYTTTGMHCGGVNNYNRDIVYPVMDFDNIFLGPDDFSYVSDNGNRSWLDADNYKDLIDYYESADDNPQFIYCLTFQNHGGYEQNDAAMDTVHVLEDLGDLTDDMNEYLSSVKLSGEAFKELTEYYEKVDRDVIICMVGDHSPSFLPELPVKENDLLDDASINSRAVPYVIWANFDMDTEVYYDYASMVDLVPMVLKAGGVPLSTFYNHICELHELLPIRTSEARAVNRNFEILNYDENVEGYDLWSQYYYMEYNSLLSEEEYKEELFLP